MSQSIVVDKCFLQGSSGAHILELAATNRLLVSSALFYELLTTNKNKRAQCFRKLPDVENPVDLVEHAGTLIRLELDSHKAAGTPSQNILPDRFVFNPGLRDAEFKLAPAALRGLADQRREVDQDVRSFISRAKEIESFFPGLREGSDDDRAHALEAAEALVAAPGSLLEFIDTLKTSLGERPLPPRAQLNESWAIYRWLQVQLLFGLNLFVRYRGAIPTAETCTKGVYEKLEHDIHDAQVLVL